MPPRFFCLLIVLAWLGLNGWLFFHDLLPRLLPHQPPPYTIDLSEEAKRQRPYIIWNVDVGDEKKVFRARTEITHPEHDVFELNSDFLPSNTARPPAVHGLRVHRMRSSYRVNGSGDLLGLAVQLDAEPNLPDLLRFVSRRFDLDISGTVRAGQLTPHLELRTGDKSLRRDLPSVTVANGSSVLLPLHPVNRIRGLRPGQSWTLRVFDPLGDSLAALQGSGGGLRFLRAKVRPQLENFRADRKQEVPCLVIDYTGDDISASTWVEFDRGLVLSQMAKLGDTTWVMYRD